MCCGSADDYYEHAGDSSHNAQRWAAEAAEKHRRQNDARRAAGNYGWPSARPGMQLDGGSRDSFLEPGLVGRVYGMPGGAVYDPPRPVRSAPHPSASAAPRASRAANRFPVVTQQPRCQPGMTMTTSRTGTVRGDVRRKPVVRSAHPGAAVKPHRAVIETAVAVPMAKPQRAQYSIFPPQPQRQQHHHVMRRRDSNEVSEVSDDEDDEGDDEDGHGGAADWRQHTVSPINSPASPRPSAPHRRERDLYGQMRGMSYGRNGAPF
ncbi:hypothetical protein GGR56DRAFT_685902 [Xylariaceae sp. FL0804]|nr:hypothetical protein GGR56DRAFT_685902 [Xylariaceae sp. FL0804]